MSQAEQGNKEVRNGFLGFVPAMVIKNILDSKHMKLSEENSSNNED